MDAQNLPASGDRTGSGNVRTRSYYGAREGDRFLQASTISLVLGKALSSREKNSTSSINQEDHNVVLII